MNNTRVLISYPASQGEKYQSQEYGETGTLPFSAQMSPWKAGRDKKPEDKQRSETQNEVVDGSL